MRKSENIGSNPIDVRDEKNKTPYAPAWRKLVPPVHTTQWVSDAQIADILLGKVEACASQLVAILHQICHETDSLVCTFWHPPNAQQRRMPYL